MDEKGVHFALQRLGTTHAKAVAAHRDIPSAAIVADMKRKLIMPKLIFSLAIMAPFIFACGASFPPPTQRMADAESAERTARELGASDEPVARLSLKLAQEQIGQAKTAMNDGDNQRADSLLIRAKADAELAVVQAREKSAKIDAQKAVDDSAAQKATNVGQGAAK